MMQRFSWCAAIAAMTIAVLTTTLVAPAQAVIVTSGPMDWSWSYAGWPTGGDVAGGTVIAQDGLLESLALTVGPGASTNELKAVVIAVFFGVPTGVVLWESAAFSAPVLAEYLFSPDLAVGAGTEYFIGIDSGLYTDAAGGDFAIGVTVDSGQVPGGGFWENTDDVFFPGWVSQTGVVTMTANFVANPEPTSFTLLGLGLVGLGARRRQARQR